MAEENVNLNLRGKDIGGRAATNSVRKGLLSLNAATVGLTLSTAALVAGTKAAINAARTQELAEKKLAATLRSTAGAAGLTFNELTKMASGLQAVTTFGDEAIIEAQSLLLTFTQIGKDVFPETLKAALNVSTAMGTDLKGSVLQLGKALNDPILGLSALSRTGITFSEEQKELIKGFVEMGEVTKAQTVILKELNTQFGGQAEAAAEGLGVTEQFSNSFGDLVENIGFAIGQSELFIGVVNTLKIGIEALNSVFGRSIPNIEGMTKAEKELALEKQKLAKLDREIANAANSRSGTVSASTIREQEATKKSVAALEEKVRVEKELIKAAQEKKKLEKEAADEESRRQKRREEFIAKEEEIAKKTIAETEAKFAKERAMDDEDAKVRARLKKEKADRELAQDKLANETRLELMTNQFDVEREVLAAQFEEKFAVAGSNEQLQNDLITSFSNKRKDIALRERLFVEQQERLKREAVVAGVAGILGATSSLITALRGNAKVAKGLAIGEAVISGALAVSKALANPPGPPFTIPLAVAIGVKTAANVATIASQSFQTPAETLRTVPGGPTEERLIRAHGQEVIGRAGDGRFNVTNNFNGLVTDPDAVGREIFDHLEPFMQRNGVALP